MAMVALVCPNCNGKIRIDNTQEVGYCEFCGTRILLKETVEVKHSGSVSINGLDQLLDGGVLANIDRKVEMLFDYIDGMKSCDFVETANSILAVKDDYRVYLAFIINDPQNVNEFYYNKFYSLNAMVSEYEEKIVSRFTSRYIHAFMDDFIRFKYMVEKKYVSLNEDTSMSDLSSSILFHHVINNNGEIVTYLMEKGFNPLKIYAFNDPSKVGLSTTQAARYKYRYTYKDGKSTCRRLGEITCYEYAYIRGLNEAMCAMKPIAKRMQKEETIKREKESRERKARREANKQKFIGILLAPFAAIGLLFTSIKDKKPSIKAKPQIVYEKSIKNEEKKKQNIDRNVILVKRTKKVIQIMFEVVRWVIAVAYLLFFAFGSYAVHSVAGFIMVLITVYFICPLNRKLDVYFKIPLWAKIVVPIIACVAMWSFFLMAV